AVQPRVRRPALRPRFGRAGTRRRARGRLASSRRTRGRRGGRGCQIRRAGGIRTNGTARLWRDGSDFPALSRISSPPSKQTFYVGELEFDIGRPAVVALAGVGSRLHLSQERVHFVGLESPAGAHRAVARHAGGDREQASLERQGLVPFGKVLGKIA